MPFDFYGSGPLYCRALSGMKRAKMNPCRLLLVFFLLTGWIIPGAALGAEGPGVEILTIATPEGEAVLTSYLKMVFQELENRTGAAYRIVELPKKRCLLDANAGVYDGLAARIAGLERAGHPNLIQIKACHYRVQHIIFAETSELAGIDSLESLLEAAVQKGWMVGYLEGSKKAAELLQPLPNANKIALSMPEQAFFMLGGGRIQAYLGGPGIVNKALLKGLQQKHPYLQAIEPQFVVSESPLYPYLHKRHKDLAPVLEAALHAMEADGTLNKLLQELESMATPPPKENDF